MTKDYTVYNYTL